MACNYDDVIDQLTSFGLVVDRLEVGRMVRCRVEGDREKRGWYSLHELMIEGGDVLIVGSFGTWQGNDNNAQKVELRKREISAEQRDSLRRRLAEDRKRAELDRKQENERAALVASKAWSGCSPTGDSPYLVRKSVAGHGIRYSPQGALVIPMMDTSSKIHGLQIIRDKAALAAGKLEKEFWPKGHAKKGHFHLIGMPTSVVLVAEGYATGASLHEATGLPVAIAFDAGNLAPVAQALHKRYKLARILVCGDADQTQKCQQDGCKKPIWLDDGPDCPHCGQPHKASNAGAQCASAAAVEVGGSWMLPRFADESARRETWLTRRVKSNDFNDLHTAEGLHVVRAQVEARLSDLGWNPSARKPAGTAPRGEGSAVADLRPIETIDELLERYALVYGQGGTVFDRQEHCLLALSDMRDACLTREIHRAWAEHPEKQIVRVREVGFDPAGEDANIRCNLWGGWPTTPKAGSCERLLDLLRYMCADDDAYDELYTWVIRWLAYPIQHPGAKLKTTLVLHGPQGTGKNMFFEAIMAIYGQYGRVIDQSAIEDKFNDWASRKLFLIADEVVARSDLYHIKNKLKAFITGEWIRINPKNIAAYEERNHVNMVFLSNERMPVVLEEDDRRHTVIWTPAKLGPAFYNEVQAEINSGGVAALHDYLLNVDMGDFRPATLPPMTRAKRELVDLSLDSTARFYRELDGGDLYTELTKGDDRIRYSAAKSRDLYELYKTWCGRIGTKPAPEPKLIDALNRKHKLPVARKRYLINSQTLGPHGVVSLPTRLEMPPGQSETAWLGDCIEAFRNAAADYKGFSGAQ